MWLMLLSLLIINATTTTTTMMNVVKGNDILTNSVNIEKVNTLRFLLVLL